jgi:tetratricopeptide (TPR) repeat protein
MQQGRYYRAVDSFTLASVYIPHDPRAHLGKSHALLAAGEYVSSAVSLARAVELDARYALAKLNLVEIIGGPDAFVQRITNLEERARAGDAAQLQFLLAYVNFQMDQPAEARAAIEAARQGLPASTAVNLLEAAIQGAAAR